MPAVSWAWERRVILKAEMPQKGSNPGFVVPNREADAQSIYDKTHCARGEMEDRVKEPQLGLFSDRTSSHRWWANQFRSVAVGGGLRVDGDDAAGGLGGDGVGACVGGNYPAQVAPNRGGDRAQHAADQGGVQQSLSVSGAVCAGGARAPSTCPTKKR